MPCLVIMQQLFDKPTAVGIISPSLHQAKVCCGRVREPYGYISLERASHRTVCLFLAGMYCVGRLKPLRSVALLVKRARCTVAAEPFLNGSSSSYVEAMYESWQHDPASVHKVRFRASKMALCIRPGTVAR